MASSSPFPAILLAWSFEPTVWLGLLLVGMIYVTGLRDLARRGRLWRVVGRRHVAYFALGLLAVLLALESPIDTFSTRLFAVHMVQHLLLLMIAPPLLLLGKPIPVLLVGLPRGLVRAVVRAHAGTPWFRRLTHYLTSPFVAWPLYVATIWTWHVPGLYDAALLNQGLHLLEHLCFLGAGLLFSWVIVEPWPGPPRLHHGLRFLYVVSAVLPNTALGALFTFSGTPWYHVYAVEPRLWRISVLDDQRMGGLLMWLPGDMMYVLVATILFFAMMARDEQAADADGVEHEAVAGTIGS